VFHEYVLKRNWINFASDAIEIYDMSGRITTKAFIRATEMSQLLQKVLATPELIDADDSALIFYDIGLIENRINEVKDVFPATALHAIAMKANPLMLILKKLAKMETGIEVASLPELMMAEAAGFSTDKIIFDSPAKTDEEIRYALKRNIRLNADSFDELERIAAIKNECSTTSVIGVRINPQTGTGTIMSTSVSGERSKFGIPLDDNGLQLQQAFLRYNWLSAVHVHIGSQGCPVRLLVTGIKKVFDFVETMNETLTKNGNREAVSIVDIGGGLPVNYFQEEGFPGMQEYLLNLRQAIPQLFEKQYKIITEFGRHIHANAGWVASRVENVKREKDYNIAMIHLGADMFLRECYNPSDWHHTITVTDSYGRLKTGLDKNKYWVAGPLCFSGDVVARDVELPAVEAGDYILIHDTGAYTLSMWSRYNSRQIPKVIGYHNDTNQFEVLKKRETYDDLIRFWS